MKYQISPMLKVIASIAIVLAAVLGGCAQQPPEFSWYHPQGGEYLFAYDRGECENAVLQNGSELGTNLDGPFFQCMHQRGYALVDGDRVISPPSTAIVLDQQATLQ